jgi:TRAP-type C4-dicarboxylate transport system substrate-binding protein
MKKKRLVLVGGMCLALIIIASFLMPGCSKPVTAPAPAPATATATATATAPAKPIELSFQVMWPTNMATCKYAYLPWIKELEARTQGKVKINFQGTNALVPYQETLDGVRSGIVDICEIDPPGMAGRLSLWEVSTLTNPYRKEGAPYSRVSWELYKNVPEMSKGLENLKVLFTWTVGPVYLNTVSKPVRSLTDYKGMKIWSIGAVSGISCDVVGAVPVALSPSECFSGLQKGVVDGVGMAHLLAYDNGLWKIAKYITVQPMGMGNWPVVMNMAKWNSLPEDVKKAFEEVSGDYAVDFFDRAFNTGVTAIKKENPQIEFINLSQADKDKYAELIKPQVGEWKKILLSQGYSQETITRVLNEFNRLEAKYCQ